MEFSERYYTRMLAAFVRGRLADSHGDSELIQKPLAEISDEDAEELLSLGKSAELSMHKFKRKDLLPRVRKVLGLLRGLPVGTLLDIGTGRGAFLYPLLDEFSYLQILCYDILPHRVRDIQALG